MVPPPIAVIVPTTIVPRRSMPELAAVIAPELANITCNYNERNAKP
jgi:hypothetical protein